MLDRERVLAKIGELEGFIRELEAVTPDSFDAFRSTLTTRLACERSLQVNVECLMDLAELLVRGLKLGLAGDEASVLDRLAEHAVLPAEEVALLREMRRFRNVLVRRYGGLDPERVYANARRGPKEFRRLAVSFRAAADRFAGS